MKVWMIYLKPELGKFLGLRKKGLYAITNHKDLLKEFFRVRDKRKFRIEKLSMDKDEYADLANENRDYVISKYWFSTNIIDEGDISTVKEVQLVATMLEYQYCDDETFIETSGIFNENWWYSFDINVELYRAFNSEIRNALDVLQFPQIYKLITATLSDSDVDYPTPNLEVDMVSVFIFTFHDILLMD